MERTRRQPVDHPERECANADCRRTFKPIRETQRFHDPECRKTYWRAAVHWTPHPCPLCTVIHSPDDAPVLDALDRLIREWAEHGTADASDGPHRMTGDILDFIARRRAILRGEVGAEGSRP